jgi:hypothetical protein
MQKWKAICKKRRYYARRILTVGYFDLKESIFTKLHRLFSAGRKLAREVVCFLYLVFLWINGCYKLPWDARVKWEE